MKKDSFNRLILACALASSIVLAACSTHSSPGERPLAVVSILPQKSVVEAIAGEHFEVMVLVPEEGNHETYEPEARQLVNLSRALIYFENGLLGFEKSWLPGIAQSNPDMKIITLSEGIQLIQGHEIPHGDHTHEGGIDPHFWLSVSAVRTQAGHVATALKQLDPEHAPDYEKNYHQYMTHLDSLDQELQKILQGVSGSSFMILHPSLGYFARDYNLEQIAIEYEGKEPGLAYLRSLVDVAREKNIRTLFVSSQFSSKSAEVIARQINAELKPFNPTALNWEQSLLEVARDLAAAPKQVNP